MAFDLINHKHFIIFFFRTECPSFLGVFADEYHEVPVAKYYFNKVNFTHAYICYNTNGWSRIGKIFAGSDNKLCLTSIKRVAE